MTGEWVFWAVTVFLNLVAIQFLARIIIRALREG